MDTFVEKKKENNREKTEQYFLCYSIFFTVFGQYSLKHCILLFRLIYNKTLPLKEFVVLRPSRDHEKPNVTYGPGPAQAGPERGPE
jgi:hypothetical protein